MFQFGSDRLVLVLFSSSSSISNHFFCIFIRHTGRPKLGGPPFFTAFARIFWFGKKLLPEWFFLSSLMVYVTFLRNKYLYEKKNEVSKKINFRIFFDIFFLIIFDIFYMRKKNYMRKRVSKKINFQILFDNNFIFEFNFSFFRHHLNTENV